MNIYFVENGRKLENIVVEGRLELRPGIKFIDKNTNSAYVILFHEIGILDNERAELIHIAQV